MNIQSDTSLGNAGLQTPENQTMANAGLEPESGGKPGDALKLSVKIG